MLRRLVCLILFLPVIGFADKFVAGKDYEVLKHDDSVSSSSTATVTEFFSYGCHWCYRLEPALNAWVLKQGNRIHFSRVPVVFNDDWKFYAKAYYTAHSLNLEASLGPLFFKAIQDEKQRLNSNEAMIQFLVAHGVDEATAKSAFEHSTAIDTQLADGMRLMSSFHIVGVPALIVNNQYKTDLQMAKNEQRLFKVLEYLIHKNQNSR